jgi:Zn-dependent protease
MTLNPVPHIDIIGTVIIPLIGYFSSGFALIGWGKPVPVNPLRFKHYHRGELETSLVGPFSNLILAFGSAIFMRLVFRFAPRLNAVTNFLWLAANLNMALCLFNLIPIHPLDGSHILRIFLSRQSLETYDRLITPYGWVILLVLLNLGALGFVFKLGERILVKLVSF